MVDSKKSGTAKKKIRLREYFPQIFAFPRWQDALLALLSSILLILAFPNFELWFLAWFALVPLLVAVERNKDSIIKSFWLGQLTGAVFYFGSCWWLTYAPIRYGGLPAPIIFLLFVPVTIAAGFFTGIFAAILARLLSKFGDIAIFAAPFVWTAGELARMWLTGNAWNALGYSQAFVPRIIESAVVGGVFFTGFLIIIVNAAFANWIFKGSQKTLFPAVFLSFVAIFITSFGFFNSALNPPVDKDVSKNPSAVVVALQPNVPMSGVGYEKYHELRRQHVEMAETALREIENKPELKDLPKIVVFPESPMSFQYAQDSEFREFLQDFGGRNKTTLLFNGWEPEDEGDGLTNSAVMVNERGEKIARYDKMRLVPFGEYVPEWLPLNQIMPTVAGRSKPGKKVSLMPLGAAVRAGVMICYESAFGDISGQFVQNGADVLVELTNDGYSGDTPILRQHLANAVFRAVETNRPVLRVTNVGISAYINERGEVSDATESYKNATRIWTVAKSDGAETFYVRNGDLFAVICTILSLVFLGLTFWRKR